MQRCKREETESGRGESNEMMYGGDPVRTDVLRTEVWIEGERTGQDQRRVEGEWLL